MAAEQYKCTLSYGAAGYVLGKTIVPWTPSPRISSAMFWMLVGAGVGLLKDNGNDDPNPKRGDNPTFNFSEPYAGVAG